MSGKLPEDIQKTVGEVLGRPGERMGVDQYMGLSLRVGLALAAERERCAKRNEAHLAGLEREERDPTTGQTQ